MSSTIDLHRVSFLYENHLLFDDLTVSIMGGKWTCFLGQSGVGKTTLLRLIAGLEKPNNPLVAHIITNNLPLVPATVAYMAQQDLLLPWLNACENALIGARLRSIPSKQIMEQADHLFKEVGLSHAKNKYPHELSGGMRQRVALVRTLLENKKIILMDEPFSAVDCITRFELQALAAELLKGCTVILVTHDPFEALRLADDIYILKGKPAQLQSVATLTSQTPRALDDKQLVYYQQQLFAMLALAKTG